MCEVRSTPYRPAGRCHPWQATACSGLPEFQAAPASGQGSDKQDDEILLVKARLMSCTTTLGQRTWAAPVFRPSLDCICTCINLLDMAVQGRTCCWARYLPSWKRPPEPALCMSLLDT